MGLTEYMKRLMLMLKLNQLVLQMLNPGLFHCNKCKNARETFQQINFGVVIILLTLESKGKFVRNRTLDLEQMDSQRVGNLMWLVKQRHLYTGHDMEEL